MDAHFVDFQLNSLLLHIALEARKPQPKYPAGTIVDGVNVGGKWMPLDDKGVQVKNDEVIKTTEKLLVSFRRNVVAVVDNLIPEQVREVLEQVRSLIATPEIEKEIDRVGEIFKDVHRSLFVGFNQTIKAIGVEFGSGKDKLKELATLSPAVVEEKLKRIGERVSLLIKATKARPDLVSLAALGALEVVAASAINSAIDFVLKRVLFPKNVLLRMLGSLGMVAPQIAILKDGLSNITSAIERLDMEVDLQAEARLLRIKLFGDNPEDISLSARAVRILIDNDIDIEQVNLALKREKLRGHLDRSHSFANRIEEYVELASARNVWNYSIGSKLTSVSPIPLEAKKRLVGEILSNDKESRDLILDRLTKSEGSRIEVGDSLTNSIEWHKGIIEAEIKYGEQIDAISKIPLVDVFSGKIDTVHKDFISTVREGKTGKVQIKTVDDEFIKKNASNFGTNTKFYKEGIEINPLEPKLVDVKKRIKKASEAAQVLVELSNIDFKTIVVGHGKELAPGSKDSGVNNGSRGFTRRLNKDLAYIEVGLVHDDVFLGFHETGHVLEHHSNNLSQISEDYVENGRSIVGRSRNIDGIATVRTDFSDQYVGKIYRRSDGSVHSTEVISSGCQELSTPIRLHRMAITDPDYLRFTLYALDRKP